LVAGEASRFALQTNVHAGDVGSHRSQLNALAVERPWPVDHVGEDRDAHSGGDHAAHGFDRRGAGPRTFTSEIHHQNRGRYLIVYTEAGKPGVVDEWTISNAIPVADLLK
jgi:hypothetical protein